MASPSPLFVEVAGPLNIAEGLREIQTRVGDLPLRYVEVKANKAGVHKLAINVTTPTLDIDGTTSFAVDLTGDVRSQFFMRSIYVQAGTDGTTFTIQGHV